MNENEYFDARDRLMKVTDEFKRAVCKSRSISLDELEAMSDSDSKIKKIYKKAGKFIRSKTFTLACIIKALKIVITKRH